MSHRIKNLQELKQLFDNGTLSKEDGDVILFDKSECELSTEKDNYWYSESYEDIAWSALSMLNIPSSGV